MTDLIRIAMWSGPRNISTAMMRAWGSRADTFVCDEPLYAHYLKMRPEVDHPGREEVLAHHEADWRKAAAWLTGPIPDRPGVPMPAASPEKFQVMQRGAKCEGIPSAKGMAGVWPPTRRIFYQKHMSHHLLPEIGRDWLAGLTHAFLVREPREMLTSLIKTMPHPGPLDTGLPQQVELYRYVREKLGQTPPIVDARDVLENPRRMLSLLCDALGVPFDEAMLSWEAGPRETDGVWAKHWYAAVERSTGFEPYRPKHEAVPEGLADVLRECERDYEELYAQRLR